MPRLRQALGLGARLDDDVDIPVFLPGDDLDREGGHDRDLWPSDVIEDEGEAVVFLSLLLGRIGEEALPIRMLDQQNPLNTTHYRVGLSDSTAVVWGFEVDV